MSHRNARLTVAWSPTARAAGPRVRACRRSCRQGDGGLTPVRSSLGRPLRRRRRRRPARSLVAARTRCRPARAAEVEASGRRRPARASSRPGLARPRARGPGPHGEPDPAPPRRAYAARLRPADRRGDPRLEDDRRPLRTRPARRAGPHGRQEDRPDPRRRRLASPRPRAATTADKHEGPRSATTTSTPSSMTTAGSPTPRSSPTRRADTTAAFFARALEFFAAHGITDRTGHDRQRLELPPQPTTSPSCSPPTTSSHKFIKPHCPWQNGKVERFNRTLANRVGLPAGLHHQRPTAPPPLHHWLDHYNTDDATPPSAATHRSADCHQPDGRVHLARMASAASHRSPGSSRRSLEPRPG